MVERYRLHIFHVYVLFRPDTGLPCYVGKGKGRRWLSHSKRSSNKLVAKLIKDCGRELPSVKIRDGLTEAEAFQVEKALIKALGKIKDGGLLFNLAEGGVGASGAVRSEKTCKLLSRIRRGKGTGPRPPEWKAAIKAGLGKSKKRTITDKWRKNLSIAARRRGHNGKRGAYNEEHCSAISLGVSEYWERYRNDPEIRAARKAGIPVRNSYYQKKKKNKVQS